MAFVPFLCSCKDGLVTSLPCVSVKFKHTLTLSDPRHLIFLLCVKSDRNVLFSKCSRWEKGRNFIEFRNHTHQVSIKFKC